MNTHKTTTLQLTIVLLVCITGTTLSWVTSQLQASISNALGVYNPSVWLYRFYHLLA